MEYPKILMGRENPNGWKLESILEKLFDEIRKKSVQISSSNHPQRDMILQNNCDIGQLLLKAIEIQKETYKELDAVEPNKGPLNPRL